MFQLRNFVLSLLIFFNLTQNPPASTATQDWLTFGYDQGGQQGGTRYSGGRDTTHAVLYALDAATGDEIYSSGAAMDSWNHYGGIAVSDHIYVTTWDARVFAFGFKNR